MRTRLIQSPCTRIQWIWGGAWDCASGIGARVRRQGNGLAEYEAEEKEWGVFVARVQVRGLSENEHDVQWHQNSRQNDMAEPRWRNGCAVAILDLNDGTK